MHGQKGLKNGSGSSETPAFPFSAASTLSKATCIRFILWQVATPYLTLPQLYSITALWQTMFRYVNHRLGFLKLPMRG